MKKILERAYESEMMILQKESENWILFSGLSHFHCCG